MTSTEKLKQCNTQLSVEDLASFEALAKSNGTTKSEMMASMIHDEVKRNQYPGSIDQIDTLRTHLKSIENLFMGEVEVATSATASAEKKVAEQLQAKEEQMEDSLAEIKRLHAKITEQEVEVTERQSIIDKLSIDLHAAKEDVDRLRAELAHRGNLEDSINQLCVMLNKHDGVEKPDGFQKTCATLK